MHISKVLTHQKKLYQGDSHSLDISNRWVTCINDNGTYTIHMFNRSKIVIANDNNVHVIHVSTDQIYQKRLKFLFLTTLGTNFVQKSETNFVSCLHS